MHIGTISGYANLPFLNNMSTHTVSTGPRNFFMSTTAWPCSASSPGAYPNSRAMRPAPLQSRHSRLGPPPQSRSVYPDLVPPIIRRPCPAAHIRLLPSHPRKPSLYFMWTGRIPTMPFRSCRLRGQHALVARKPDRHFPHLQVLGRFRRFVPDSVSRYPFATSVDVARSASSLAIRMHSVMDRSSGKAWDVSAARMPSSPVS